MIRILCSRCGGQSALMTELRLFDLFKDAGGIKGRHELIEDVHLCEHCTNNFLAWLLARREGDLSGPMFRSLSELRKGMGLV